MFKITLCLKIGVILMFSMVENGLSVQFDSLETESDYDDSAITEKSPLNTIFSQDGLQMKIDTILKVASLQCKEKGIEFDEHKQKTHFTEALVPCVANHFNVEKFQQDLNATKQNGSMDEVFIRHCELFPMIMECVRNTSAIYLQCFNADIQEIADFLFDLAADLPKFICDREGTRLAMFVANGGATCIQEQRPKLEQCINSTSLKMMSDEEIPPFSTNVTLDTFKEFICQEILGHNDELKNCVHNGLSHCENGIAANMADSLLKYLKRKICNGNNVIVSNHIDNDESTNSSVNVTASLEFLVFVTILSGLF